MTKMKKKKLKVRGFILDFCLKINIKEKSEIMDG